MATQLLNLSTSSWNCTVVYDHLRDPDNKRNMLYRISASGRIGTYTVSGTWSFSMTVNGQTYSGSFTEYYGGDPHNFSKPDFMAISVPARYAEEGLPATFRLTIPAGNTYDGSTDLIILPDLSPEVSVYDGEVWTECDDVQEFTTEWNGLDALSVYDGSWKEA